MADTKIEWTQGPDGSPGKVWNPVTGCTKVSPGCDNCYAETVTNRFHGGHFEVVRLHSNRLDEPLHWKKPRMIFTCSMGDLFHSAVPWDFIFKVFEVMRKCPQHTFQILTKRPGRMAYFADWIEGSIIDWPSNVWAGTSVESAKYLPRLDVLARVPAKVRFVSVEPLLGPVDLKPWLQCLECGHPKWSHQDDLRTIIPGHYFNGLSWVIVGGESGPKARPAHPDWIRQIRDDCQAAGVPFFLKQWGEWTPGENVERTQGIVRTASWFIDQWSYDREDLAYEDGLIDDEPDLYRVGKKAAGAVLDGREWREMPNEHQAI